MPLQISPGGRVLYVHPTRPISKDPVPSRREFFEALRAVRVALDGRCQHELDVISRVFSSKEE